MTEQKSMRVQQIEARKALAAKFRPKIERVRVTPANDDMRRVLKHPSGVRFAPSGSVEWPLDTFTRRRIKDGSVKAEARAKQNTAPRTPTPAHTSAHTPAHTSAQASTQAQPSGQTG